MNNRMKEFYKMRNRLPKDARQWVKQDVKFLNSLDEHDFNYLLDWEYTNAMEQYQTIRTDALNPKRAGSFNPEKPKNVDGEVIPGSHEFDNFEETYEAQVCGDPELIYKIWINTHSDEEFLKKVDQEWDSGNFQTPYCEFKENIEVFLRKVAKMDYDRKRYETMKR